MALVIAVSVPSESEGNLDRGIQQCTWGWTRATIAGAREYRPLLEAVGEGDVVVFSVGGGGRERARWDSRPIRRVVIGVVTGQLFESEVPLWDRTHGSEVWPVRIGFVAVADLSQVDAAPRELLDMFQKSIVRNSAPYLVRGLGDGADLGELLGVGGLPLSRAAADPRPDFEGVTDAAAVVARRLEQEWLRGQVVGDGPSGTCSLCGRSLPVGLLRAAHIVKRSRCSYEERIDLANVMAACVLGCDEMFERRLVVVDHSGAVVAAEAAGTADLADAVASIAGRACSAFSPDSAPYFERHAAP